MSIYNAGGEPEWWYKQYEARFDASTANSMYEEFKLLRLHLEQLREQTKLMYGWFEDQQKELILREQHPNLKEAWDHYQTLKVLVTPPDQV